MPAGQRGLLERITVVGHGSGSCSKQVSLLVGIGWDSPTEGACMNLDSTYMSGVVFIALEHIAPLHGIIAEWAVRKSS